MNVQDILGRIRSAVDELEACSPQRGAVDPLGGLERAAIAEELASTIRHDLRNNLASIRNAAFYLKRRTRDTELWKEDPRMDQFFALIENMVVVSSGLIEERLGLMRLFAQRHGPVLGRACVARAVATARVPPAVELLVDADPGQIDADVAEMALAIRCLVENAAEALPEGGRVHISARPSYGRYAIAVHDDGPGIPDDVAERMFDAFYTNKAGHAGLGLNIARRIARRHDGEVEREASPRGTTMILAIPLSGAEEERAATRILLVDDDENNRLTLSVLLEGEGFAVDVAGSFREATEKLAGPSPGYALVILDQHLGDGDGAELVPLLRERHPDARRVLLSGSVTEDERALLPFDAFVVKGTSFLEVLAKVRELLSISEGDHD